MLGLIDNDDLVAAVELGPDVGQQVELAACLRDTQRPREQLEDVAERPCAGGRLYVDALRRVIPYKLLRGLGLADPRVSVSDHDAALQLAILDHLVYVLRD